MASSAIVRTTRGKLCNNEARKLASLMNKCYAYLNDNYESFKPATRIKIALQLISKRVPQQMDVNNNDNIAIKITHESLNDRVKMFDDVIDITPSDKTLCEVNK